jgi:hypothetical protein
MQVGEFATPKAIFEDYAYFSSQSASWLEHCRQYSEDIIAKFDPKTVLEIASNDGGLLKCFQKAGVTVLGVEPATNVAEASEKIGIPVINEFFDTKVASLLPKQDLIVGNNVLAHVPNLNDFIAGMHLALAPEGIITMEFPYLQNLLKELQFDTIYHEHFSYFSLASVQTAFSRHGLKIFDVDVLPTHGGSLRIYAAHQGTQECTDRLLTLKLQEDTNNLDAFKKFADESQRYKRVFLRRLTDFKDREYLKHRGGASFNPKSVSIVAYGAPAKGNTLLNYCGVSTEFIDYCVDTTPYKQGRFLPGSHIPVYHPDMLKETKPDLVYIQPWNWSDEILQKLEFVRRWGGEFLIRTRYR